MLKVSEIKAAIPEAMEQIVENLQLNSQQEEAIRTTPITVCNRKNCQRIYKQAIRRQASFNTGFSPTTEAEVIWGYNGAEILVYQFQFRTIPQLKRALWHEWGHLIANSFTGECASEIMKYHSKRQESGNPTLFDESLAPDERRYYEELNFGFQLWNEFIAEVVANYALAEKPHSYARDKQNELKIRLLSVITVEAVHQDILGHYCAMVLSDATVYSRLIENNHFSIGLEYLPDEFSYVVEEILHLLDNQLSQDSIFAIRKETIMQLGAHINELWDLRFAAIQSTVEAMFNDN